MAKPDKHSRSMLPIPDVRKSELTAFDAKDPHSRFPPIETVLPPDGAPNVLIILLDHVGFGSSSAFGGPWSRAGGARPGFFTERVARRSRPPGTRGKRRSTTRLRGSRSWD